MTITLTAEQRQWLETVVAEGRFASIEEAVQAALVGFMTMDAEFDDDWVKPLLDEARADVARGETISLDEFKSLRAEKRKAGR